MAVAYWEIVLTDRYDQQQQINIFSTYRYFLIKGFGSVTLLLAS